MIDHIQIDDTLGVIRRREDKMVAMMMVMQERGERLEEKVDALAQAREKEERLVAQVDAGSIQ